MKERLLIMAGAILLALFLAPFLVFADPMHEVEPPPQAGSEVQLGSEVKVREQNGIAYVNGGVGEQRDAVDRMSRDFNLRLTMSAPGGKFSAAPLKIDDRQGKTLVDVPDAGPLFLAKLPSGTYTIRVSPEGQKPMTRTVTIAEKGHEQLVFTIPDQSPQPSRAGDAPE